MHTLQGNNVKDCTFRLTTGHVVDRLQKTNRGSDDNVVPEELRPRSERYPAAQLRASVL